MSLTSYRAAPPRAKGKRRPSQGEVRRPGNYAPKEEFSALRRPGNGLLSQVLRHSTIGAKAFDGRVRDGIGSNHSAKVTRPAKGGNEANWLMTGGMSHLPPAGEAMDID
jgi:hypothetical protein